MGPPTAGRTERRRCADGTRTRLDGVFGAMIVPEGADCPAWHWRGDNPEKQKRRVGSARTPSFDIGEATCQLRPLMTRDGHDHNLRGFPRALDALGTGLLLAGLGISLAAIFGAAVGGIGYGA